MLVGYCLCDKAVSQMPRRNLCHLQKWSNTQHVCAGAHSCSCAHTQFFTHSLFFQLRIHKTFQRALGGPTPTFQAFCPRRCRISDAKRKSCMSMSSARRYQAELGVFRWVRAYSFCLCVGCFFSCGWIWFYFPVRFESSFIFLQCPSRMSPHAHTKDTERQNASEYAVYLHETNMLKWGSTYDAGLKKDANTICLRSLEKHFPLKSFHVILNYKLRSLGGIWESKPHSQMIRRHGPRL